MRKNDGVCVEKSKDGQNFSVNISTLFFLRCALLPARLDAILNIPSLFDRSGRGEINSQTTNKSSPLRLNISGVSRAPCFFAVVGLN